MDREVLPQEEKVWFKGLFLALMQLRWAVGGEEMGRFQNSFAKPSLWQETRRVL